MHWAIEWPQNHDGTQQINNKIGSGKEQQLGQQAKKSSIYCKFYFEGYLI